MIGAFPLVSFYQFIKEGEMNILTDNGWEEERNEYSLFGDERDKRQYSEQWLKESDKEKSELLKLNNLLPTYKKKHKKYIWPGVKMMWVQYYLYSDNRTRKRLKEFLDDSVKFHQYD